MSVKIIHTADLHLGRAMPYLGGRAAQRRNEVMLSLEKITDLCRSLQAEALIISGDLFELPCPEEALAVQAFSILGKAGVPVVIAAGNHDCLLADSPYLTLKLPENVTVLSSEVPYVKIRDGVYVFGCSFTSAEMQCDRPPALPDHKAINILALHADVDTQSAYNPITADWLAASGAHYAALGHIHKRSPLQKAGSTFYSYCGCPEGQGFDETGVCGVYSVTVEKKGCTAEFVPVCKRIHAFERFDVTELGDSLDICSAILDYLNNKYGDGFADNMYKLHLVGSVPEGNSLDRSLITEKLSQTLYYIKTSDKTRPAVNLQTLAKESTLKGIFVRRMLEKLSAADDNQRPLLEAALEIGLAAFEGEVSFDEDQ